VNLRVFQAGKGDCLLLTSRDGKRVLIDGGMPDAYREHVAPALGELGGSIDLLYVSHIDDDHIGGVLELLSDELDWRVFDFQEKEAHNPNAKPPKVSRPPPVKRIWHNAFHMQIGQNTGPIEDALAASAAVLEGSPRRSDVEDAARLREFTTGVDTALRVSQRVSAQQLGIPLNAEFHGQLAMAREGLRPIRLGSLKITVIGPFEEHLDRLRKVWNEWLADVKHRGQLDDIRDDMNRDAKRLETGDVAGFRDLIRRRALDFSDGLAQGITIPSGITEPNLASLMMLVEEGGKTLLLTGDGAGENILEGLERAGRLEPGEGIHVDTLKVQHHGATANVKAEFCRRVTADNYVLCGNGQHENPELEVLTRIIDSRLDPRKRGTHEGADGPFKLWFNSSSTAAGTEDRATHMAKVEKLVADRAASSHGRLRRRFLQRASSFEFEV
jgi:hypothetical protein